MKELFIKRIKKGLPYAILFLIMSVYFYVKGDNDIALSLFIPSILLFVSYFIIRKSNV